MAPNDTPVNAGYWYCKGELQPENIDSKLFNHLFAAFAGVSTDTYQVTFPTGCEDKFKSFAQTVKIKNRHVKSLLSIGGETDPSVFAKMASQPDLRQEFIASSIHVAREFGYDGLNLSWLYPNSNDQKNNLANLLKEWRAAANGLLLTLAVFRSPTNYPIDAIQTYLDWINVVAYDLQTPASSPNSTVPPAPLHNPIPLPAQIFSVDSVLDAWIDAEGVLQPNKLVLGLPFHGRAWILEDAEKHEIFSPAKGAAPPEPILYRKIKDFIKEKRGKEVIDHSYATQYCYVGTKWIDYDGKDIIFGT